MKRWFSSRIVAILFVVACLIVAAAFSIRPIFFAIADVVFSRPSLQRDRPSQVIDLSRLRLELATTDDERQLGLGGRQTMAEDEGMLFLFDAVAIHPFWMKGMNFPIDIIWLDGDRVVDVVTLSPPASEDAIPATHVPRHLANRVLEINAGLAKKWGIVPGARLVLP